MAVGYPTERPVPTPPQHGPARGVVGRIVARLRRASTRDAQPETTHHPRAQAAREMFAVRRGGEFSGHITDDRMRS